MSPTAAVGGASTAPSTWIAVGRLMASASLSRSVANSTDGVGPSLSMRRAAGACLFERTADESCSPGPLVVMPSERTSWGRRLTRKYAPALTITAIIARSVATARYPASSWRPPTPTPLRLSMTSVKKGNMHRSHCSLRGQFLQNGRCGLVIHHAPAVRQRWLASVAGLRGPCQPATSPSVQRRADTADLSIASNPSESPRSAARATKQGGVERGRVRSR